MMVYIHTLLYEKEKEKVVGLVINSHICKRLQILKILYFFIQIFVLFFFFLLRIDSQFILLHNKILKDRF